MKIAHLPNKEIETVNLWLRRPLSDDVVSLRQLCKDEIVRQFLGGVFSDEIIDRKIAFLIDHWAQHGFGQWVVCGRELQVAGICGLHHSEDGIELSYMFFPIFWGRGWASEAANACLDFGFNILKLQSIIAITQEANQKSCHLLEKTGMHHKANLSRFNAPQRLYELKQDEWVAAKRVKKDCCAY